MIQKKIRDETLGDVIKFGTYRRDALFYYRWQCNICGNQFVRRRDLINHIIVEHLDDTLPDVDPVCPDYIQSDESKYNDDIKLASELLDRVAKLVEEARKIAIKNGWK